MSSADLTSDGKTTGDNFVAENCCYTQIRGKKCSFKWIIDHYPAHATRGETLKSSVFSAVDDNFMWCVELLMSEREDYNHQEDCWENNKYVAFRLYPNCTADYIKYAPISGEVKVSVLKNDNSEGGIKRQKFVLKNEEDRKGINVHDFIKNSDLCDDWLSEDKLTVFCEFNYVKNNGIITFSTSELQNEHNDPESSLTRYFERLFINKQFTDVTVSLKDKKYRAHKIILAARSSVFEAMFEHDMKEQTSNLVEITDMNCDVFEEMLRYIYTGHPNNLEELAFELLAAADKYNLKELKSMCETAACKRLSVENVLEILILADMHRADRLKMQTLQFIRMQTHKTSLMDTNLWNVLCTSHPQLVKEIMTVLLKY